jgi:voltage-dependent calcium channel L type alpha-1D
MYDGWLSLGNVVAPLYFISIVIFGVWIVMNMFSAIMVQSVMEKAQRDNGETDNVDDDKDGVETVPAIQPLYVRSIMRKLTRLQPSTC